MVSLLELRDEANKVVEEYLIEKNIKSKVDIEIPDKFGDFAFSCFSLAPLLKKAPAEIASEMASNLNSKFFSKIEAIGPYVNFHICTESLKEVLDSILDKKDDYGNFPKKNDKIVLEHTSANPTGPLHVGRARNPIIGDTLARILKRFGYDLEIDYFVNDVGKQVAMLIWGINRYPPNSSTYLDYVKCYQSAYKDIKENPELEEEIRERLEIAGIKVIEARINFIAYAEEIAGAMLRRQQATAVVAARFKIVEGAVSMVQMALEQLSEKEIVNLDEEKKAAMISNLMVVLCGDKDPSPVVNTGTLHH